MGSRKACEKWAERLPDPSRAYTDSAEDTETSAVASAGVFRFTARTARPRRTPSAEIFIKISTSRFMASCE